MDPDLLSDSGELVGIFRPREMGMFLSVIVGQLVVAFTIFRLIAPHTLTSELASPLLVAAWTIGFGLPLSLFEYLYHRYLLHSSVLPFLASMQRAHSTHHGLTNVKAPIRKSEPEKLATVTSEYPIEEEHQEEAMKFPLFSGPIFIVIFLLLLGLPFKLLFPNQPVICSLLLSVVGYYSGYEAWHAVLHPPYDKFWKPRMESPLVQRVYSFHLMHHWRPTANLAIVGFWGAAVWDHVFRTYHRPENLPLHRASVTYQDAKLARPRWPISAFDERQGSWARRSRRIERFLAKIFFKGSKRS